MKLRKCMSFDKEFPVWLKVVSYQCLHHDTHSFRVPTSFWWRPIYSHADSSDSSKLIVSDWSVQFHRRSDANSCTWAKCLLERTNSYIIALHLQFEEIRKLRRCQTGLLKILIAAYLLGKPCEFIAQNVRFDGMAQLNFTAIVESKQMCKYIEYINERMTFCRKESHLFAFFANALVFRLFGCFNLDRSFSKLAGGCRIIISL